MGVPADELDKQNGTCSGFVIMPDHVHAILWFGKTERLSPFVRGWWRRQLIGGGVRPDTTNKASQSACRSSGCSELLSLQGNTGDFAI